MPLLKKEHTDFEYTIDTKELAEKLGLSNDESITGIFSLRDRNYDKVHVYTRKKESI